MWNSERRNDVPVMLTDSYKPWDQPTDAPRWEMQSHRTEACCSLAWMRLMINSWAEQIHMGTYTNIHTTYPPTHTHTHHVQCFTNEYKYTHLHKHSTSRDTVVCLLSPWQKLIPGWRLSLWCNLDKTQRHPQDTRTHMREHTQDTSVAMVSTSCSWWWDSASVNDVLRSFWCSGLRCGPPGRTGTKELGKKKLH